jgi:hypothetical protein
VRLHQLRHLRDAEPDAVGGLRGPDGGQLLYW